MSTARKIAINTVVQVFGKALVITLGLIGFGLMTRYLGQEAFGYYTTVYAFLAIFGILIDLGLQMTTTQLISDPKENESQILSNALTIRLISAVVFLGVAPLIILFFPYPGVIKIGTAIATIGFVFNALVSTLTSFFQKHLVMHRLVIANTVGKIFFIISILIVINSNLGILGIIGATVIDSFFATFTLFYFALQKTTLKPSFDFSVWQKILHKTWPIALTIALNLIYFKGDIFIMSLVRTQAEVGLYGAPYRILEVLISVAYSFLGLLLPVFSATVAIKNFDRLKKIIQSAFDFLIIVTVPLIFGGLFVSRQIMVFIAGPQFLISGDIMKILLPAVGAIFIGGLFGYVVVALDKQKEMIKFYFANAVFSLTGYLILIPLYSYWGAAVMTVFTELFIMITAGYVLFKTINYLPNLKLFFKVVLAGLLMTLFLSILPPANFVLIIFIGASVYFTALYLLKGYDKKVISEIMRAQK